MEKREGNETISLRLINPVIALAPQNSIMVYLVMAEINK